MPSQKNTTNTERSFDVAITGAGVAGCAAAIFLLKAGYRVCLLNKQQELLFKIGESLPPVANKLLQELGVWDAFITQQHLPCYGNKSAWGAASPVVHDFMTSPYGHGWHIDRLLFEELLLNEAGKRGAVIISSVHFTKVLSHTPLWKLQSDKQIVEAPFLFDAGGRNSSVAKHLELKRNRQDKQLAVCGFFEQVNITEQFSFIEAVAQGWWYTAPLPHGRAATTLFTIPACLEQKKTAPETLMEQLTGNPQLYALLRKQKPAYAYLCDAGSSKLETVFTENHAAIGDAALTFDPVSSHGLVMAMTTARDAAACYDTKRKGQANAFESYSITLQDVFSNYEAGKTQVYQSEQRWPDEPYWQYKQAL